MGKRFLILDTDGEPLTEITRGAFTVGITEVVSVNSYLVGVYTEGTEYLGALYPSLGEAQQAIQLLMTFKPSPKNNAYQFPQPSEPVSALEVLGTLAGEWF